MPKQNHRDRWKVVPLLAVVLLFAPMALAQVPCEAMSQLQVASVGDDGSFDGSYGPEWAVDGRFDPVSRWASESTSC